VSSRPLVNQAEALAEAINLLMSRDPYLIMARSRIISLASTSATASG